MHTAARFFSAAILILSYTFLLSAPREASGQAPAAGQVLISEFRLVGPNGMTDEFIEFYNNTDAPVTVRDPTPPAAGQAGWALVTSDNNDLKFVIPDGTVIPARGHFLAVRKVKGGGGGYTLDAYPAGGGRTATGDLLFYTSIYEGAGIALFRTANRANFTLANRLDAVGPDAAPPLFREGAGVRPPGLFNDELSFYRDLSAGSPKDTDNNAADFVLVNTGGYHRYVGARLGAPGPENLSSPVAKTSAEFPSAPVDPTQCATCAPNRVRSPAPDPAHPGCSQQGTIAVRRRFTNNTGRPVTRLRFRVIDITTLNSPGYENPAQADVRALSSGPAVVATGDGRVLTVAGTTLEQPPAQPNCGGYNSSLSAGSATLTQPLAAGASLDLQFLLGVVRGGSFRFLVQVEALP